MQIFFFRNHFDQFHQIMHASHTFYTLMLFSNPFVIPKDKRTTVAKATAPEDSKLDLNLMKARHTCVNCK